jgi:uncharacterized protein (TIGR00290 family)
MKVAISWTGGKDSALACYKAAKEHDVAAFVNFIWQTPSLSHPNLIAKFQAEAVHTPFLWEMLAPPYPETYKESILKLKNEYGIEGIVTGDITQDAFHGTWIDDVCNGTGVQVIKPLWEKDRAELMDEVLASGLKVIFTCVKEPWFTEDWLGRTIDKYCIEDLKKLHDKNGVDISGEFGEYHTMVMDAPFFAKSLQLSMFKAQKTENGFTMNQVELSLKTK